MTRTVLIGGEPAQLTVEGGKLHYEREDGRTIDVPFSVERTGAGSYSVLVEDRAYRVTVGGGREVQVNGQAFEVESFDPRDIQARKSGVSKEGRHEINSPMPGKIVRILVDVGDQVEEGRGLVVVEAMKMQNELKSPKAGRVVEVRAVVDSTVIAGEVVLVVE